MGAKGAVAWPLVRLSGWIDDQPLSAVGALLTVGALVTLLASVGIEVDPSEAALAYEGVTLEELSAVAIEQPAYVITAAFGAMVFLFYDG